MSAKDKTVRDVINTYTTTFNLAQRLTKLSKATTRNKDDAGLIKQAALHVDQAYRLLRHTSPIQVLLERNHAKADQA